MAKAAIDSDHWTRFRCKTLTLAAAASAGRNEAKVALSGSIDEIFVLGYRSVWKVDGILGFRLPIWRLGLGVGSVSYFLAFCFRLVTHEWHGTVVPRADTCYLTCF